MIIHKDIKSFCCSTGGFTFNSKNYNLTINWFHVTYLLYHVYDSIHYKIAKVTMLTYVLIWDMQ